MDLSPFKILTHIVNVTILYFILRWLLYKPILKFLKDREARFQNTRDDLDARQREVEELKKDYTQKIEDAKNEAALILEQSSQMAEERSQELLDKARMQAQEILGRAKRDIENEKKLALDALKAETAAIAIEIASKVIQREISLEDNQKIIDDFMQKVV